MMSEPKRLPFVIDDEAFQNNPWSCYNDVLTQHGVYFDEVSRCWFVFNHDLVTHFLSLESASTDYPFRASRLALGLTALDADGSDHSRLRPLVSRGLGPSSVKRNCEQSIRDCIDYIIDRCIGEIEFVKDFAALLPTQVILHLMGLDIDRAPWFIKKLKPIIAFIEDPRASLAHCEAARIELRQEIENQLRCNNAFRESFLLTNILRAAKANVEVKEIDVISSILLFLAAGTETTAASISNAMFHIISHPELRSLMQNGKLMVEEYVDELLRLHPPMHFSARFMKSTAIVRDVTIPKGAFVQLCFASANRDPAVFSHPTEMDFNRSNSRKSLTFGTGRHGCPGSFLAKAEIIFSIKKILSADLFNDFSRDMVPVVGGRVFKRPREMYVFTKNHDCPYKTSV